MTRIVPSQVVDVINRLYRHAAFNTSHSNYSRGNAASLRGIVDLIKQIPQELLVLPADQYANLAIALGAIEQHLQILASGDAKVLLQPVMGYDPLVILRDALIR